MYNFVHLFIGKEFEQIVMKMGRATLRNSGSSAASFIGYYLVDKLEKAEISCKRLSVKSSAPSTVLEGFEDYTDIQWADPQNGSLPEVFSEMYASVLGGNNVEDADRLYVCVHVPLYKPQSIESLKLVYSAFLNLRMPMTMMFVGYGDDLSKIIEPSFKIESPSAAQVRQFMKMKNAQEISVSTHMFVIQNSFSNGIPLNLDESALAEVMSLFAIVTSGYYKQMFPPTVDYKDIISFGLTALNMDRYMFVEYMLNKVLLHAIDKSRMMVQKVSVNDAFDRALEIVNEKDAVLSKLLAEYDNGDHQNYQQTCNELAAVADTIVEKATAIFERDNDVTMQAATLAALLSKNECELFTNIIYDPQKSSMNDLLMEPIDYFIKNDSTKFYAESDDDPVVNPIPRIKELNSLIINSEAEIRNLKEELDTFEEQKKDVSQMGETAVFEDDCIVVNNRKYRLLPAKKEELLEETYSPKETSKTSVDLTADFRPIQNQGQQGSCAAFSLTSVFEYVVKLNTNEMVDLSEAFLYYNSRKLDQGDAFDPTQDTGTTFTSGLKSLSQFGLAEEAYCKYDDNVCYQEPSEEAYKNASIRKLIKALNVDRKVSAIKSALSEGYPVLGSFTLCPSFNPSSNGLVSMPTKSEIDAIANGEGDEEKHSRHGMVFVGYEDKLQAFLVRNSWGADWGNKGYCYIPYAYVENEYLFSFACIITEIQSLPIANVRKTVEMKVDDTDITIRYHLCKIAKEQEESNLEAFRNERNILVLYLEKIKRDFSNPNKSEQFIAVTNVKKEEEKELLVKGKKDLQRRLDEEDENYNLFKKRTLFLAIAVPVLFFLGILFNNFLAEPVIYNTMTYQRYEEVPSKLANTGLVAEEPFLYYFAGSFTAESPEMSFLEKAAGYTAVGVLAPISIITGNLSLDVHFFRVRPIGIMSIVPIAGVLILILFFIARGRWNEWREVKARLEAGIDKKNKEIAEKQKEIDNFRAKTHYAREWLRLLGDIQNRFQQRYTKLIFLINNMREKYATLQEYDQTKDLELEMPFTTLLDKERLDKYFEEILAEDEICDVDFCENIENYQIDESYVKQYIKKLTLTIQQRMAEHRDVAEFMIHDHIAHNSGAKIAMPVKSTLRVEEGEISMPNLIRRSGPFFHTNSITRGVIPDMTYTFMPEGGNADFVLENPYLAIFMKAACIECDECVMFQKKNDKK